MPGRGLVEEEKEERKTQLQLVNTEEYSVLEQQHSQCTLASMEAENGRCFSAACSYKHTQATHENAVHML